MNFTTPIRSDFEAPVALSRCFTPQPSCDEGHRRAVGRGHVGKDLWEGVEASIEAHVQHEAGVDQPQRGPAQCWRQDRLQVLPRRSGSPTDEREATS